MRSPIPTGTGAWLIAALLASATPLGSLTLPPRPGQRDFVLDQANLIQANDKAIIQDLCGTLLRDTKVPLVVENRSPEGAHPAR